MRTIKVKGKLSGLSSEQELKESINRFFTGKSDPSVNDQSLFPDNGSGTTPLNAYYVAENYYDFEGKYIRIDERGNWLAYNKETGTWSETPRATVVTWFVGYVDVVQSKSKDLEYKSKIVDNFLGRIANSPSQSFYLFEGFVEHGNYFTFDTNTKLLNFRNGVLDLDTREFREHRPEDCFTYVVNAEYNPDAYSELVDKCLHDWMNNNEEKLKYLQILVGQGLGGLNEEKVIVLEGDSTRNGKSTFVKFLEACLGSYLGTGDFSDIQFFDNTYSNKNQPCPFLYNNGKKRYLQIPEATGETKRTSTIDSQLLKRLSGTDTVSFRAMYSNNTIETSVQFTMILICNKFPVIKDHSVFDSDRIKLVSFNRHFKEHEQIKNLKYTLMKGPDCEKHKSALMAWLVKGYYEYIDNGMQIPIFEESEQAVNEYREEADPVMSFMNACFTIKKPDEGRTHIKVPVMMEAYRSYCNDCSIFTSNTSTQSFNKDVMRYTKLKGITDKKDMYAVGSNSYFIFKPNTTGIKYINKAIAKLEGSTSKS